MSPKQSNIRTAPKPTRAPAPAGLWLLRAAFGMLGRVAPALATSWAYRLWFTTRRFRLTRREARILTDAERIEIMHRDLPVATYAWGQGPVVLLIHGWHGAAANFADFIEPLTQAGFRAVSLDQPAHGVTPGRRTTIFEIVAAIKAVAAAVGPVHGMVTHSFGAPCMMLALLDGASAARTVLLSPPASVEGLVVAFAETLGLSDAVVQRFRRRLERQFGEDIWDKLSPAKLAPHVRVPALIIHDRRDRAMVFEEGQALARAWPGARFHATDGLGHRRLLHDADVIARAVDFLRPADRKRSTHHAARRLVTSKSRD